MLGTIEENEKQIRARKAQAYKAMLDEQVLYNQLIRQNQRAGKLSERSQRVSRVSQQGETVHIPPYQQHNMKKSDEKLPLLRDRQTFYGGKSRYVSVPLPPRYQPRMRVRTDGTYLPENVQSQIQEIQSLLESMKERTRWDRSRRRRHVSRMGIQSIDRAEKRRKIQGIIWGNKLRNNLKNWQSYQIPVSTVSISSPRFKQGQTLDPESRKSKPKRDHSPNPGEPTPFCGSGLSPQRQRFVHLLKKVKNRGDSLLLKWRKHPPIPSIPS